MKTSTQRWFMPWRWSRWTWAMLLALVLPVYFLSAVPALRLVAQYPALWHRHQMLSLAYRPIWKIDARSKVAAAVIDWEDRLMDRIQGKESDWNVNPCSSLWYGMPQVEYHREGFRSGR